MLVCQVWRPDPIFFGKLKRFEIEKRYAANYSDSEEHSGGKELSGEDKQLLSSVAAQNALEFLSKKQNRLF